jgi:preprotein translocase subunit SecY
MVSAAEQLAANLNFGALARAEELKKRIYFTLGALMVYRLGTYIPLPGIDPAQWESIFRTQAGGILGMFNMFAGGGIQRMAIFALNIMPYISASIIIQLMTTVSPTLEQLKKEGEQGRKTINQYTRYLTFVLAAAQAYGISLGLEGAGNVISDPGWMFRISAVITLTGGTMFLVWLTDQITARGIGNGLSLLLFAGIMVELPSSVANMLELGRQGVLSNGVILGLLMVTLVTTASIVFMERARRWLLIEYSERQVGGRTFGGRESPVPLKLNMSGLIPALFAPWLASLTMMATGATSWGTALVLNFGLIVFFSFVYARFVFNPHEAAENLHRLGGFIPGFAPGEPTARRIDHVLMRVTTIGGVYLALVCLMPQVLVVYSQAPFFFGGTPLLVVVCVTLDIQTQLEAEAERPT